MQTPFYEVMGGKRDKMINTVCRRIGDMKAKWINLESKKHRLDNSETNYVRRAFSVEVSFIQMYGNLSEGAV